MKPSGGVLAPPGTEAPELWEPYKVWRSDLWECEGCGHLALHGHAFQPVSQDFHEDFEAALLESQSIVNDC